MSQHQSEYLKQRSESIARWKKNPSRNVRLALLFTFWAGVGRGTWSYTVLSGYLYALTNSHADVGVAEGAQGIAQLAIALLAGFLIDRWQRRDKILKLSSVIGIVTACILVYVLSERSSTLIGEHRFFLLTIGLGFFGSYQGFWNTSLETIYADSVPTGMRDRANSDKFVITLLSTITGPILANIYFLTYGADKWHLNTLRDVFIGGVALCVPPMFLLCMFRDSDCLGASADAVGSPSSLVISKQHIKQENSEKEDEEEEDKFQEDIKERIKNKQDPQTLNYQNSEEGTQRQTSVSFIDDDQYYSLTNQDEHVEDQGGLREEAEVIDLRNTFDFQTDEDTERKYVLRITALIDLISGLGSGMSIKFFPLYFEHKGLTPAQVNWVYITAPLVMAVGSHYATLLGVKYGRPQMAMLFGMFAAFAMFGLGFMQQAPIPLCLFFYYLSCAQHCSRPLKKSILMDYCLREHRGGWNAVDSITRFGWSGSAVAGGYIIDRYSYEANYIVTSIMLAVAASFWLLLFNKTNVTRISIYNRDISESCSTA